MTEQELQHLRREKWHLTGQPVRTIEDARAFMESVGFCLMYPQRPPVLVPGKNPPQTITSLPVQTAV